MKVIDLLNKIANGEMPKKIIFDDKQWEYDEKKQDYFTYDDSRIDWQFTIMEYINDEIEIIEDTPKKIEKLNGILEFRQDGNHISKLPNNEELMFKINEIIDYINNQEK